MNPRLNQVLLISVNWTWDGCPNFIVKMYAVNPPLPISKGKSLGTRLFSNWFTWRGVHTDVRMYVWTGMYGRTITWRLKCFGWMRHQRNGLPLIHLRRAGAPLLTMPFRGRFSLTHKHKHKHKYNISISRWEHPRHKQKQKKKHKKNDPIYLSYAVLTCAKASA